MALLPAAAGKAGVGRSSGINHGEICLELDGRIIPGLNCYVNNTRVKMWPLCICDWRIGTAKAPCLARQHRSGSTSCANSVSAYRWLPLHPLASVFGQSCQLRYVRPNQCVDSKDMKLGNPKAGIGRYPVSLHFRQRPPKRGSALRRAITPIPSSPIPADLPQASVSTAPGKPPRARACSHPLGQRRYRCRTEWPDRPALRPGSGF